MEEKKLKRKIERVLVLFLATMLLAIPTETILLAKSNNQSKNRTRVRAEFLPNDPYWSLQWGLKKIEADWAWNETFGSPSILVAVIDSGIEYNHTDLAANYVGLGYDWINNDPDPMDDHNHGTRVAGILAAQINNEIGIAGLAQVKIMAEKVLDNTASGYVDQLASGIRHATDQGAKIISMSLSADSDDPLLYSAVKYAYEKNVLLVAAAGNEESDVERYPAAYDEVIAVTATNQNDQKSPSSNYGDWIELAAPGVNIYSTIRGNDYGSWSGTSFACPYVSGLAALLWTEFPNATRDWIRTRLRETADDLGDPSFDNYYGYGRINARKAIYGTSPAINYTLTITTTADGTTNPYPGNHTNSEGHSVSVLAIPDTGYELDHWELDGVSVGSCNPYPVFMDNNHTLHAVFELLLTYRLTILSSTGGTTNPTSGTYTYNNGTYASVIAVPDTHYLLDYWLLDGDNLNSSNTLSILMTDNHTLQPVFILDGFILTITATTGGTTNHAPGKPIYMKGTITNISAIPSIDYNFDHWELDGVSVGSSNPYPVFMDNNHTLLAVFKAQLLLEGPFYWYRAEYWIVRFGDRRPVRLISNYY